MAEVHAARMAGVGGFEKLVAIKLMLSHLAEDDRFVDMFLDEGRLAVHVSSPHVVQTLDLGRAEDGTLYLVMELVRGISLSRALRNVVRGGGSLPVGAVVESIAQAAQGLEDAHRATTPLGEPLHLVHRDVSPQNLLLGADGRVRIVDFGIARAVQRSTHTQAGEMKGKFAYFAPEQTRANAEIDHRVDIFALGVVAWEALTGKRLFKADNPAAQLDKVRHMPVPSVRELRPEVPEPVAEVIVRALDRDPAARWGSAGEMARALRETARRADLALPDRTQLGTLVRAWGGEQLTKLEENLRRALSAAGPAVLALSAERPVSEAGTGSGVRSDSLPGLPTRFSASDREGLVDPPLQAPASEEGLALLASDAFQGSASVAVPAHGVRRRPLLLVAGIVGLALGAAALWSALASPDDREGYGPGPHVSETPRGEPSAPAPSPNPPSKERAVSGSAPEVPAAPTPAVASPEGASPLPSEAARRQGRRNPSRHRPDRRTSPSLERLEQRAAAAASEALAPSRSEPRSVPAASPRQEQARRGTAPRPAAGTASGRKPSGNRRPSRPRRRGPSLADVDDFERELGL